MNHTFRFPEMSIKASVVLGLVFLTALVKVAEAQELRDYRCTIERVDSAAAGAKPSFEFQQKNYVGKDFTVERRTGLMAGAFKNSYLTKPQVVDLGSADNAYKVVTTLRRDQGAGVGSNVYALVINEYEKAQIKPFLFMENNDVYFGTCVHF
jgi:hypothetical protein